MVRCRLSESILAVCRSHEIEAVMAYIINEGNTRADGILASYFPNDAKLPYIRLGGCGGYSVAKTFDCGQAFRFDPVMSADRYDGIALDTPISFEQVSADEMIIRNCTASDFAEKWERYLSLDVDYDSIDRFIIEAMPCGEDRAVMAAAVEAGHGIRILRQAPFECLISFIISQNNNIPRIKKLITALCGSFGENGRFPTPEALAMAGEEALFALKTGFRAGYIHDAAVKIASGEIELQKIIDCDDFEKCTEELCRIRGVGPKVSACALLFGFGKTEAFPVDVWMKKSLARHFPNGFDVKSLGKYAGIAQQYLFYYERYLVGE